MIKRIDPRIQAASNISREQGLLQELFGGGGRAISRNPDSECLPQVRGDLMPNRFRDYEDPRPNTEDCFGMRKKFRETGQMFGL